MHGSEIEVKVSVREVGEKLVGAAVGSPGATVGDGAGAAVGDGAGAAVGPGLGAGVVGAALGAAVGR